MRTARRNFPGIVHHLMWRFVDHRYFFDATGLRKKYLWWLARALAETDWRCIAYALMSNHIHIAAIAGREPLSVWSRRVNRPFAQLVNQVTDRIGPVFADRPEVRAVEPVGIGRVIAYIHNNPVRANVVEHARDSRWTSHRSYLGLHSKPKWLCAAEGLELAGFSDATTFDAFVDSNPDAPPSPDMKRVARAARHFGQINAATAFGQQVPLVMRHFARIRVDPRRVLELVAAYFCLAVEDVTSRKRTPSITIARAVAVHCGIAAGLTGTDMGAALGISQQAVSRITRFSKRDAADCDAICSQLLLECRAATFR